MARPQPIDEEEVLMKDGPKDGPQDAATLQAVAPPARRSASKLRELSDAVDRLNGHLADLDDQRENVRKQRDAAIKAWQTEAAKRK